MKPLAFLYWLICWALSSKTKAVQPPNPPSQHLLHLALNKHSKNVCREILSHKTPSVLVSSSFHLPEYMTGSDTIRKKTESVAQNQVIHDLWPISVHANITALCFNDIKNIFSLWAKQTWHSVCWHYSCESSRINIGHIGWVKRAHKLSCLRCAVGI